MNYRYTLLTGAALIAACVGQSAAAQTGSAPDAQAPENSSGDIIVTAQRRSEKLIDVPASVVALDAASLQKSGVTSTRELTQVVPGLNFVASGTYQTPSLRGVTVAGSAPGIESPVAIFVDGVYQTAQAAALFDLPDITQVEVLKGPQGTLYGRNATGGAILITTQEPGDAFTGKVHLAAGSFGDHEVNGFISGPITQGVGFSLSAAHHDMDGYSRNIVTGKDAGKLKSNLVRGKLAFEPTEGIKFTLAGYWSRRYDESTFASTVLNNNTAARRVDPNVLIASEPNTTSTTFPSFMRNTSRGVSLRGDFDLGIGTLSSISSYNKVRTTIQTDADYTALPVASYIIQQRERAYAQDLIFTSNRLGPVDFLLGASYIDIKAAYLPLQIIGVTSIYARARSKAGSAFGELTYHLTDQLSLTGGLRYTEEQRSLYGSFTGAYPFLGETTFHKLSPSIVAKYDIADLGNVYASYKEGFKSGDFNMTSPLPGAKATKPEQIAAYEVGFKSRQLGPVRFSTSAFYYDYTDIIVSVYSLGTGILTNAAKARMKGVDFEAELRATKDLTFSGSFSILDATYKKFENAVVNAPRPPFGTPGLAASATCPAGVYPCGNVTTNAGDISGNKLPRAPKSTINLASDYRFDIGSYGEGRIHLNAYRNGGFFWELGNRIKQSPYWVANGRLTVSPADYPNLSFSAYVKNIFNEHYTQGGNIVGTADTVNFAAPRSFGVSFDAGF